VNTEELDAAWRMLHTPDSPHLLEGTAIVASQVWAAVDFEGHRHLLIQVPADVEAPPTRTRGLRVTVGQHQVQGVKSAQYLDLACLSPDATTTFTAVAADIGASAGSVPQADRVAVVADALSRWQWFWDVEAGSLSEHEALGLFAELWFLYRWAGDPAFAVRAWTASAGSRHDFQWPERSVEVKATSRRAEGAVLHRIEHLDQLADPEQGKLFLFSLRVVRDQLARNTLPSLVDHVSQNLRGNPPSLDDFSRKLSQRGYSPAHRSRLEVPYRVLGEYLYSVGPDFPRLTAASFINGPPAGITDVSYVIDMTACDPWIEAKSPAEWTTNLYNPSRLSSRVLLPQAATDSTSVINATA
jgi:hypothetical protein